MLPPRRYDDGKRPTLGLLLFGLLLIYLASLANDGHQCLAQTSSGQYWKVDCDLIVEPTTTTRRSK